jgi:hypothetical protein
MPYPFKMPSDGTLEPVIRHRIYAPLDAEIKKLPDYINQGVRVTGPTETRSGTVLLELRSTDLEEREVVMRAEERKILEEINSLDKQLLDTEKRMTPYERAEKVGQKDVALIQLEATQQKLDIFERYEKPKLHITSPIDGVIVSSDLRRRLTEKLPLLRTQYVMEVADLDKDWQLELQMPEKRMGYIMKHKKRLDEQEKPLRVEFWMPNKPDEKHYGTVKEIHDRAEVRTESGGAGGQSNSNLNTVTIKVALDDQESLREDLMFGAECKAQINCGNRPLGYVIFWEVIVYIQKNILFRWF